MSTPFLDPDATAARLDAEADEQRRSEWNTACRDLGNSVIPTPLPPNPNLMANVVTGRAPRNKGGRPVGSFSSTTQAQARRIARAEAKLIGEKIARDGVRATLEKFGDAQPEHPVWGLRTDAPNRTVSEAKDAALKLINKMLWTLEKQAEEVGVSDQDEQRVLKLLAGLNAALPKQAETPNKDPKDMTEDELRKVL